MAENERYGKYVELAPKHVCAGISHLEKFFQDVVDKGGEGVILRDPSSPYVQGRSVGYLKHKVL
jgi:DNA ligase 1